MMYVTYSETVHEKKFCAFESEKERLRERERACMCAQMIKQMGQNVNNWSTGG